MDLDLIVTRGLGDTTYLVSSGGEAALIDPQRDAGRFLARAAGRDVAIRFVLETHVHNDYVSGAVEVRNATGAEIGAPARGRYAFDHRPLREGDEVRFGGIRLVAMETPGHTPEHLAYLVFEDGVEEPAAVFSGGSLMVGGAGRTDLLGPEQTDGSTRAQFRTLRRLAALPADTRVLPTHGAGSFCGAGPAPKSRSSTIGAEHDGNAALRAPDEQTFVREALEGLPSFPAYYRHMAVINRAGPRVLGSIPKLPALTPERAAGLLGSGVWVVDARAREAFAGAHIPGSLNVELDPAFGSYVGWLVPFDAPLVLVLPFEPSGAATETVIQLLRVGYEHVLGFLDGGVEAWHRAGLELASYPVATVDDLCREIRSGRGPAVLDVRQQGEWDAGRIPDSVHLFVGDLPERLPQVAELGLEGPVWTICASGHRSAMAASLLAGAGIPVRAVARGGVEDWLASCSSPSG
jgi:glyoxylase-like metal-dependent hydrolase (beta-lactamase superfamily II)/rhodanese-related sulfurtransferase